MENGKTKYVLIGLILIVVAVLLIGAGTYAYFSDTQTSGLNLFTTGSIALAVNGNTPWTGSFTASLTGLVPGTTSWGNVTLSNIGQNPMDVWVEITNVQTSSLGSNYPKSLEPAATDINGVCRYGLIVAGTNVVSPTGYTISTGSHQLTGVTTGVTGQYMWLGNIAPGGTLNVNQSFCLDSATTNWAQDDQMSFNVVFYAQQSQGTPQPAAPTPQLASDSRP